MNIILHLLVMMILLAGAIKLDIIRLDRVGKYYKEAVESSESCSLSSIHLTYCGHYQIFRPREDNTHHWLCPEVHFNSQEEW